MLGEHRAQGRCPAAGAREIVSAMATESGTAGGATRTYEPRHEARVLRWPTSEAAADDAPTLSEEQMQAGVQLHQLLNALAKQKPKERAEAKGMRRFLPPIDDDRRNQVFLLDGARGSGKTALLVTLLDLWNALALGEALKEDARLADRKAKLDGWSIDPSAWPIVPVGMLDLQPLPAHTPVLLRIVECLARVVEAIEGDAGTPGAAPPWYLADEAPCKSRKSWDALMRSIVAGWDHASRERWGKLDPEQSFHELDRAVRDYRDLPSRFDAFVGDLTKDFKQWRPWRHGSEPLFVLAIDDADMVPERAAEVLDALRLLYHPRVAFLLTGDSELFYRSREEAVARVLRSPRSGSDTSAPSPTRDPFAVGLARDIYDKIVPQSHRCAIPSIPANRRAGLVQELSALRFPTERVDEERVSLGWLLEHPLVSEALPDRLRALRELAIVGTPFSLTARNESDARAQTETEIKRAAVRVALHLWDLSLTSARLSSTQRVQFDSVVQRGEGASELLVAAHDPNPGARLVPRRIMSHKSAPHATSTVSHRWSVFIEQDHVVAPPSDRDDGLPVEVLGALVLAHNVAFETGQRRTREAPTDRSGFASFGAFARYERPDQGPPLQFAWPLPWGRRLLDLCNFCLSWDRLREFERGPAGVDSAARWFVTLWGMLVPSKKRRRILLPHEATGEAPAWPDVAQHLSEAAEDAALLQDDERDAYQAWARLRVLLLAAPESGLAAEHAEAFLDAFKGTVVEPGGDTLRERVRVERSKRAARALGVKTGDPAVQVLLDEIDARSVGHPWQTVMNTASAGVRPSAREQKVQRLTSALAALGIYREPSAQFVQRYIPQLSEDELHAAEDIAQMVDSA